MPHLIVKPDKGLRVGSLIETVEDGVAALYPF
jgi:hypothetical protein